MSLAIEIRFLTGRFHATPWGRHVNEGAVEWPPSPWRILRALVAAWKRIEHTTQLNPTTVEHVVSKLAENHPEFVLPPACTGHTRHYMPMKSEERTLVLDAFVVVDSGTPLVVYWKDVDLDQQERETIDLMLKGIHYLGRSESLVTVQRVKELGCVVRTCSFQKDAQHTEFDPVEVMVPDKTSWNQWSFGKSVQGVTPQWNLLAETSMLHKQKWNCPPGSKVVTYFRPRDALTPKVRDVMLRPFPEIIAAQFALDGVVLPNITETLYVGELARQAFQARFGRLFDNAQSRAFSGKDSSGTLLKKDISTHFSFPPMRTEMDISTI